MSLSIENLELKKFYSSLMQEVATTQATDEEGANSEQIFTQFALDLLAEAGEAEDSLLCYDEKALGTPKQHKINAYAISGNLETVDLFITIFKGTEEISKITPDEVRQAATRISNFFRKAIYSNENEKSKAFKIEYVHEIEESSPIFQFANTLGRDEELRENLVRVNSTIILNGTYLGDFPDTMEISGYKIYFKVFDIEALYNVSEKSHIPIEIDFKADGFKVPCIQSPSTTEDYQSYLAIIPGEALAAIYDKYGARLLEQNVRSFLQVGGKKSTNYGIRKTIIECPEMFLAYNNGLTTTADDIEFEQIGTSLNIVLVKDFQIVNGGQTTASIYHTLRKDKVDISKIYVQMKISLIKNKDKFSDIVSNISAFANTQNKVSASDLSSNRPYHIELEKLSRNIFTPINSNRAYQTKWFYERARGQYKNAILKEFTPSKKKAFELKNPKSQLFSKEELAKYINSYQEISEGKKILVGPHFVVRGNQKNYVQFMNFNIEKKLNNIYFEDTMAKAILFKTAEKVYGVKPNAIGDMRYITVPYTITLLNVLTKNQLDLYKIWKAQEISIELKSLLYSMMQKVEEFIKNIPGGLYGEWAKKEECWNGLKENKFDFDLNSIKSDFIDKSNKNSRVVITDDETSLTQIKEDCDRIKSIPVSVWRKIDNWGEDSNELLANQINLIDSIIHRVKTNSKLSDNERLTGVRIIDVVLEKAPELLFDIDEIVENEKEKKAAAPQINYELIQKMITYDRRNKRLKTFQFTFLRDIIENNQELSEHKIKVCLQCYYALYKYGFRA